MLPNASRKSASKLTRGSPKSAEHRFRERSAEIWAGLLEMPALWALLVVILGTWSLSSAGLFFAHPVTAGTIASRDYVAPRDLLLLDEETTQEKERRAREEVLPVYDFDSAVLAERQKAIEQLFALGRDLLAKAPEGTTKKKGALRDDVHNAVAGGTSLKLTDAQVDLLIDQGFSMDLEDRLRSLVRQALNRGVVGNKSLLLENRMRGVVQRDLATGQESVDLDLYDHLGYPEELQEFLEGEVRAWPGLPAQARREVVDLLLENVPPNLLLNRSETLTRKDAAAASVERAFNRVRKGQVIVRQGDEITPTAARVIRELVGERQWQNQLLPLLGTICLVGLTTLVVWLGARREKLVDRSRRRLVSEHLLLLVLSLVGAKLAFLVAGALSTAFEGPPLNSLTSYLHAVPFAALALVATLLCGRNAAVLLSLVFSILVSRLVGGDADSLGVVIYSIGGSLAAVFALDQYRLKQRLVMTRVGLRVGLVNVLMILILVALGGEVDRGLAQLGFDLLMGFAGGILAAAVASFALPILESFLGITTDIKLVELSNTNLPLLRRLAFEAPGTFQHSLMVANLAKEGCEAVGADAVLAYTGALYHDVGKVFRPEYFIENQRHGQNPHDKLTPSMSSLILISHIKEGMELARRHHLPRPILDAIEQHHGNRLIKFFYSRAVERADPETGAVPEEKFRYPGPRPANKVMGILMLADGVEAASRTLVEPTPARLRSVVRAIVDDCLRDGQLDHTDLTLSDLKKASDAFLRVLSNIYHQRVDYPGFDFNSDSRERRIIAEVRVS